MSFHVPHADIVAAPLLLALWTLRGPLRFSPWPALMSIAYFGHVYASTVRANIRLPQEWDYGCFWLYGQIAAAHQNIYDPRSFAAFSLPFTPSSEFVQAVLNVGFPYPPPTMALFLPLGYIHSYSIGLAAWYAVQFAALAVAARILARTFMPAQGWAATALIVAMVLALPATQTNIGDAQTNFLLLLFVALSLAGRSTVLGAVWQIVAIWIKPYTLALFLVDVVRAQWPRLLAAVGAAAVSCVGATLLLGPRVMLSYVQSNPAGREPAFTFVESVNQSLLATVLRQHRVLPTHLSALHEPAYLVVSIAFLLVTALLCARAPRNSDLGFTLALLLGTLVYPATLTSYGVVLIVPLLVLWKYRETLPGKALAAVGFVAVVTVLQGLAHSGFGANLLLWIVVTALLGAQLQRTRASLMQSDFAGQGLAESVA